MEARASEPVLDGFVFVTLIPPLRLKAAFLVSFTMEVIDAGVQSKRRLRP